MQVFTTRATPVWRAASSTLIVPATLMLASQAGSSIDLRTSICAARWKTMSGRDPANSLRRRSASVMSASWKRDPAPARASRFSSAAGREVVDDRHLVAAVEEGIDEIRPDEAGSAGDQGAHGRRTLVVPCGATGGGCWGPLCVSWARDPPTGCGMHPGVKNRRALTTVGGCFSAMTRSW